MLTLPKILRPSAYWSFVERRLTERRYQRHPNLRGIRNPPGHYYSPLLNIESLKPGDTAMPFDGEEDWAHVNLHRSEQRAYFDDLLGRFPFLPFPGQPAGGYRYFTENEWFCPADAFTLSGILRREKPRRIVEVGCGYSSAVMLDTLEQTGQPADLTFIEPYPDRLNALLTADNRDHCSILVEPVQTVALSVFDQLEAQDVLFIDSSHVAKVGSDVAFLFLRVLPRLKRGVFIHIHDIFYPFSYPVRWIREGRAWNESLFLRMFLINNPAFEVVAFNSFASYAFPELFREKFPAFLDSEGASLWLRKVA